MTKTVVRIHQFEVFSFLGNGSTGTQRDITY